MYKKDGHKYKAHGKNPNKNAIKYDSTHLTNCDLFVMYRVDQKSWRVRKKCTVASKIHV